MGGVGGLIICSGICQGIFVKECHTSGKNALACITHGDSYRIKYRRSGNFRCKNDLHKPQKIKKYEIYLTTDNHYCQHTYTQFQPSTFSYTHFHSTAS